MKPEELVDDRKLEELARNWIHGDYASTCGGVPVDSPVDVKRVQRMARGDPEGLLVMVFKAGARFVLGEVGIKRVVEVSPAANCEGCDQLAAGETGCPLMCVCPTREEGAVLLWPGKEK